MTKRKSRKNKTYSTDEKLNVLHQHLVKKVPVTELCDKLGISPGLYYGWQKNLFDRGFADAKPSTSNDTRRMKSLEKKLKASEERLQQKNEVIAELLEEHVSLKKKLNGGT
jgi:transposase